MKNILMIPLDERPCNYDFPQMLAQMTDCRLIVPPRAILGQKKQPGDVDAIAAWLEEHISGCEYAVLSIDTLLYSGIVPSRLHYDSVENLLGRLERLRTLKERNPDCTLFAFSLIMRNPSYASSDEEPDYYADWGREIHRYGYISHKTELGIESAEERAELSDILSRLPDDVLRDYMERRAVNLAVNREAIRLAAQGVLDFVIIPQDDSSPYGVTAKDQQIVRDAIDAYRVNCKVYMYPDADAVCNTLFVRAVNGLRGERPLVYVRYASSIGGAVIPLYEDRIVSETIKYQILAAGGITASSAAEADLILLINVPGGNMQDVLQDEDGPGIRRTIEYDAFRNLIELVEYAAYQRTCCKKDVIFADIAYGNGGDAHLFRLLQQKRLLWDVAGYAGWNTSSNTLGTCIPMGMLHHLYGQSDASRAFLALRYLEDIGYDVFVRQDVTQNALKAMGLTESLLDGARGAVSKLVREKLQAFADAELSDAMYVVTVTDCCLPWNRMFEAGIRVSVTVK